MSQLPVWDLSELASGPDDPQLLATLDALTTDATAFATRYSGQLAALEPAALATAIAEYEGLLQRSTRPATFAGLRFSAQATPENGALVQKLRERTTEATLPLLFFPIELAALGTDKLAAYAADPALAAYQRYLNSTAASARYNLTEAEERIVEEKSNTGDRAFVRLFRELTSAARFTYDGEERTLSEVLNLQYDTDREVRKASSLAVTEGLKPHARTLAFIYNTLIQDKATEDKRRGYTNPEDGRHLGNELTQEIVEAVCAAAETSYPLVGRYYEAKRRLLGLDTLMHYDRYAPLAKDEPDVSYDEAKARILSAIDRFEPTYAATGRLFFDNAWIDAAPGPDKQSGAFCNYVAPDHHPYLFQSYLGKASDMRTLMHELGHGIHGALSREQSYLNFYGTLPMAEVASTFAEMLLFAEEEAGTTGAERRTLFAQTIEATFSTIQRQTAMYRFEQACHRERASGELSVARLSALWQESVGKMFDGKVTLGEEHALWWSYIPHFIGSPFYVYAYAFGKLLAMALYRRYEQEGAPFAAKYVAMLQTGGAKTPAELVAPLGVDLTDPSFWQGGIEILETWVTEFERLCE